ncbi:hypothetical protein SAMN03080594_1011138 [Arenibacter palladensis]|uniref:Uncharacterized protein n=1 Tax=Arenibacter palladensis TaxID=237373 RepID=A0A1M4VXZ9_9FLAO|nr:hypothetical protein SAMN03080594_1011138 [Arenibacter palladensis]
MNKAILHDCRMALPILGSLRRFNPAPNDHGSYLFEVYI